MLNFGLLGKKKGLPSANRIALLRGDVDTDGISFTQSGHTGKAHAVAGTVAAFNGSAYGQFVDSSLTPKTVSIVGDFVAEAVVEYTAGLNQAIVGGDTTSDGILLYFTSSNNNPAVFIDGNQYKFTDITLVDGTLHEFVISRVGPLLTMSVDGSAYSMACSEANLNLKLVGAWNSTPTGFLDGDAYNVKATDSEGVKIDLPFICLGSDIEDSGEETVDTHCLLTSKIITERTYGSDRANTDGYSGVAILAGVV